MFERAEPDPPGPPPPPPLPPILDGKYQLEERLGEGTTGIVFRALHLDLRRTFAVKILKPLGGAPAQGLARFRQEAEALGRLRHPHIVEVTDFGVDGATGTAYLVLEHLQGRSLAELLRAAGPLPLDRALAFLAPIAAAVDAAHRQGVLHRDLKPANVFLDERPGAPPAVKVLDFGLAELLEGRLEDRAGPGAAATPLHAALTAPGALPGTPLYAAPEVIRDQQTSPASDVYSLGVLAYELLAGRPPFHGPTSEVLEGHLEQEPPPIPGLAPEAGRELFRLLDKDPTRRPASAAAAVAALARAAARVRLAAFQKAERPRRLAFAALFAAVLALGGFLPFLPLPGLEGMFADWRARLARQRPPDSRLLLVTLDEATLAQNSAALADPVWADELGRRMAAVFAAGARGVAVDLNPPPAWSASRELAAAIGQYADRVTLGVDSEGGQVLGMEVLAEPVVEALGPVRARSLFGFINLDEDPDGTVRHGRRYFELADESVQPEESLYPDPLFHPTLAERAAGLLRTRKPLSQAPRRFWIDSRIRWQDYPVVSWRELPARLAERPQEVAGRLVLFGGTWTSSRDRHRFGGHGEVSGLVLHALMIDSLVAGPPVELDAPLVGLGAALVTGLGLAGVLASRRPGRAALLLAGGFAGYLGFSLWGYSAAGIVAPVTLPGLMVAAGLAAAWIVRLRLPPFPEGF